MFPRVVSGFNAFTALMVLYQMMEPPSFNSSLSTRCNNGMFHFHQMDGFGNALRFIPINSFRPAGCHCAKAATACANISQDHKSCRACAPAFAHVRAVAAFANGVQFMRINQVREHVYNFRRWAILHEASLAFLFVPIISFLQETIG